MGESGSDPVYGRIGSDLYGRLAVICMGGAVSLSKRRSLLLPSPALPTWSPLLVAPTWSPVWHELSVGDGLRQAEREGGREGGREGQDPILSASRLFFPRRPIHSTGAQGGREGAPRRAG